MTPKDYADAYRADDKRRLEVWLDRDSQEQLAIIVAADGVTASEAVRIAIREAAPRRQRGTLRRTRTP